jgi:hypothetical protein
MERSKNDVWVGLFVLIGAVAILFLALQSANLLSLNFQSTYQVTAKFDNIGGLKRQAAVKSAGVVVVGGWTRSRSTTSPSRPGRAVAGEPLPLPQGQLAEDPHQRPAG